MEPELVAARGHRLDRAAKGNRQLHDGSAPSDDDTILSFCVRPGHEWRLGDRALEFGPSREFLGKIRAST
jgi:hypothetical protein